MILIDGKQTARDIRAELKAQVEAAVSAGRRAPGLAVILVGEDPASQVYVRNKERACAEAGILSFPYRLPADTTQEALLALIAELNGRDDVDGILLQLPLPKHLSASACLLAIDPAKDVDGFHPENVGRLSLNLPGMVSCTPAGVIELLRRYNLPTRGKKAVVLGRSDIVGKPLALLLARPGEFGDATVTLCHSRTPDLAAECRSADFLFLAIGRPRMITGDMVREGAVIIDVGINRTDDGLCGDADFESVSKKAAAITPVPGGVGPMTIAMLLKNTGRPCVTARSRHKPDLYWGKEASCVLPLFSSCRSSLADGVLCCCCFDTRDVRPSAEGPSSLLPVCPQGRRGRCGGQAEEALCRRAGHAGWPAYSAAQDKERTLAVGDTVASPKGGTPANKKEGDASCAG